ncbi:AMP-binding protein [Aureibaculum luteum]|uniref:AMP-binding protein n=1 Tax=Aureibaculum luteum TaxID=1548456 RepID=UPI002936FB5A|nr:AMP-binding protein [Aureibaculum luteum]
MSFSKNISSSITTFLEDWFDESKTVNVQTSGSTGTPKSIKLKKEYMVNSAIATGTFFDLRENTTALLCLSTDYIAGKMMLVRALTLGWHLDVIEASSSPLQQIDRTYDFCAMVPLQVHHSLEYLDKVKKLIIGGGAVDNNLFENLQSVSTEIFATYGMTETITHIAVKRLNNPSLQGVALKSSNYETLDKVTISKNSRGCLEIEAPEISDEIITTNDLVEIITKNEFKWLGRADNVINSGGIKLIPEQIEEKLAKIIHQRFFVAGVPDDILGEKLILIIECEKKENKVIDQITTLRYLTKFEVPKEVYFIDNFIFTETKKINRKATLNSVEIKK